MIPPLGMRAFAPFIRTRTSLVILFTLLTLSMVAPLGLVGVAWWLDRPHGYLTGLLIAASTGLPFVPAIVGGILVNRARQRASIAISDKTLSIVESGLGNTERLNVAREAIEEVSVQNSRLPTRQLVIRCRGKKEPLIFLQHLPERELQEIAHTIRKELGLSVP